MLLQGLYAIPFFAKHHGVRPHFIVESGVIRIEVNIVFNASLFQSHAGSQRTKSGHVLSHSTGTCGDGDDLIQPQKASEPFASLAKYVASSGLMPINPARYHSDH